MKNIVILIAVSLAFCAYANTEGFNFPDLAFIPDGVYEVFPEAYNTNSKFNTIQGAITQALCDGFTPDAVPFKQATVLIYPNLNGPYMGDGPDNEINVPVSVRLVGKNGESSVFSDPRIKATLVFDNSGRLPGASDPLTELSWTHSNLNIIQPSPDKSAIKFSNDLSAAFVALSINNCYVTNSFTNATAPIVEISNFAFFLAFRTFMVGSSGLAPVFLAKDASTVELFYCNVISHKVLVSEGIGAIIPGTLFVLYFSDIVVEPGFLGNVESEIKLFEFKSAGIDRIFFGSTAIVSQPDVVNYTMGSVMYDASALSPANGGCPRTSFFANSYDFTPIAGGTQLVYDSPDCPVDSGNFVNSQGIISNNVGNLRPAVIF